MPRIVNRNDSSIKEIDKGLKNRFKWEWLNKSVEVEDEDKIKYKIKFDLCFEKLYVPGRVLCTHCNDEIKYGTSGKKALEMHVKNPKHIKAWKTRKDNMELCVTSNEISAVTGDANPFVPLCDRSVTTQVRFFFLSISHNYLAIMRDINVHFKMNFCQVSVAPYYVSCTARLYVGFQFYS